MHVNVYLQKTYFKKETASKKSYLSVAQNKTKKHVMFEKKYIVEPIKSKIGYI